MATGVIGNLLTTGTTGGYLSPTYLDRKLIDRVKQTSVWYQFCEKKPLPPGNGKTILWNVKRQLDLGQYLSEGIPTSIGFALSTHKVSAIVRQLGGFTSYSDFADLTLITDIPSYAMDEITDQAARTIDKLVQNEIMTHDTQIVRDSCHYLFKTSTEMWDYWGETSGVSTVVCTVSSTNVAAVSDFRNSRFKLQSIGVPFYDGNEYMAVIGTAVADDITGDTAWIGFHQYASDKSVQNIYNGEIGKVYGIRFVVTNNEGKMRGSNAGGTASTVAYASMLFGKNFIGCSEIDGGVKTMVSKGGNVTIADPLDQVRTVGWKANFAPKVLNTSCGLTLFTGSGDTTANYSESASSGLYWEDIGSY